MNAITSILIAAYIGTVLYQGNGPALWAAVKEDAPSFIQWLVGVLLLILIYQARGYLGPARATVAAVIVGGALAVLLTSADSFKTAVTDIGAALKGA